MKKFFSIVACLSLIVYLNACTSQEEAPSDEQAAQVQGGPDSAKGGAPSEGTSDAQKTFLDQPLPEDSLGQAPAQLQPLDEATPPPAAADNTTPPAQGTEPTPPPAADNAGISSPVAESQSNVAAGTTTVEASKPAPQPLQKIKEAPFKEGDQLLNAVYVARPGDDYKKISSMIYGNEDQIKNLKAANHGVKTIKPGMKIYYNSPKRPTDEAKMMTYYEETGVPPELYIAKKGDDLKKVSESLLGFPGAWKEVWATNALESKGKLAEGTELKYWKSVSITPISEAPSKGADSAMAAATADMAVKNELPPPPSSAKQAEMMPPPPPVKQAEMMPPPPPPPPVKQAEMMPPPPPPSAETEMPPPPPPPPTPVAKKPIPNKAVQAGAEEVLDQDTMMALAAAGILAIGAVALIIIRKKKAKKEAAANFESQMGA